MAYRLSGYDFLYLNKTDLNNVYLYIKMYINLVGLILKIYIIGAMNNTFNMNFD